jgi:hypothetical protein
VESTNDVKEDFLLSLDRSFQLMGISDTWPLDQANHSYNWFFEISDLFTKIDPIYDIGNSVVLRKNCSFEQLAIFFDKDNRVQINTEIWDALDSLNKAALVRHELMYKNYRELNDKTSEKTRADIACIFSKDCPTNVINIPNLPFRWAMNGNNSSLKSSFRYVINDNKIRFYFYQFENRQLITKTTAEFQVGDITFFDFLSEGGYQYLTSNVTKKRKFRAKIESALMNKETEIELLLSPGQPISFSLYENGVLIP